jgi:hypothetical protein
MWFRKKEKNYGDAKLSGMQKGNCAERTSLPPLRMEAAIGIDLDYRDWIRPVVWLLGWGKAFV